MKIVKQNITKFLGMFGFHRGRKSLSDLCLSLKNSQGTYTVLQIGANDGTMHDPLQDIIKRDRPDCYLVEPVPEYFASLEKKYAETPNVRCINTCISETNGTAEMYVLNPAAKDEDWKQGIASLDKAHHVRCEIDEKDMVCKTVRSTTFETLIEEQKIGNVDVLVTDCEGYDLKLLRIFPFEDLDVKIVQVEMDSGSFSPAEFGEAVEIVTNAGFQNFHRFGQDLFAWKV